MRRTLRLSQRPTHLLFCLLLSIAFMSAGCEQGAISYSSAEYDDTVGARRAAPNEVAERGSSSARDLAQEAPAAEHLRIRQAREEARARVTSEGYNGALAEASAMQSAMQSAPPARRRVRRRRAGMTSMIARLDGTGRGRLLGWDDTNAAAPAPAAPPRDPALSGSLAAAPPRSNIPLPQNGVLASDFIGGNGVNARLDDLLSRGVMVGGENVRIGAFRDRDPLPYALPRREGLAMHVNLERTRLNTTRDEVHMQIALMGRRGEAPVRPKVDVRLVLDRSGSMTDNDKWQNAIAAAHQLVDHLSPNDTFGLVSYSDEASIDVRPMRVGNRRAIHRVIDRVEPGGGTNIGSALDMVARHRPSARGRDVGLVILLSDGRATIGQTNARMLGDQARALFDQHGVLTTTIGLGNDFDENLMLSIAREGSGSYHFVRRPSDVAEIMTSELDERIQAVAQGLRVQIKLKNGVVAEHVYGSRLLSDSEHQAVRATEVAVDQRVARELGIARTRQREEQEGLRIHLPTFRRGDQHVILLKLSVPAGTTDLELAEVKLDYKDLIRNRNASITREAEVTRVTDQDTSVASTERNVKRTVLAFQAGETLQSSADAFRRGRREEAFRILSERQELLVTAARLWRDPGLQRDADLLGNYQRVLAQTFDAQSTSTIVMAMNYYGDRRMR